MPEVSRKQLALLGYIRRQIETLGRPPTYEEIRKAFRLSTKSLVAYHLRALEAAGHIERTRDVSRGIRLVKHKPKTTFSLPIFGTIQAGRPVESSEVVEAIELTRDIVPEADGLYGLRVHGDSMVDAMVNDGDIVVLRHQREARNGEMVAVRLEDRGESTLKRFYRENGHVRLQAANPEYPDMVLHPSAVEIQGKVVAVIRRISAN
jgi:repressor LexA